MAQQQKPEPMDEDRLQTVVSAQINQSISFMGGELSDQRRQAMEYYYGEGFGNEQDGRSQVILTDVRDTIEWIMPSLLKIFTQSDELVKFNPVGREDEDAAEQKTDYVNYLFHQEIEGFVLLYAWFKDALLQKNGITKTWWDESEKTERESFTGLTLDDVATITEDEGVEIVGYEEDAPRPNEMGELEPTYRLTVERTQPVGRVMSEVVPPEEFLISRRAVSLDSAPFLGHRTRKTVSELLEMGFDEEKVLSLPSGGGVGAYNEERIARFDFDDEYPDASSDIDPAMREVWITECYLKVDYDGDGRAELRKITVGSDENTVILENEEVDEHPFDALTPVIMPHKFFGLSIADLIMDLQLIRSTILRQMLDNMYNVNNARSAISSAVNLDDYLDNRPAGAVRVDGAGPVSDHIMPLVTPSIAPQATPLLDWLDDMRATRTGVTRYNQGLDADTLNDTATGVSKIVAAANQRIELIARIFAETGVKKLFGRVLRLVVAHQDKPREVRLKNQWVMVDPRTWNTSMDMTVEVGLGYDNREQEVAIMQLIAALQEKVVALQQGVEGPLVTIENVWHVMRRLTKAGGLKHAELFWNDPTTPEAQELLRQIKQRPNPEMEKAKAELALKQQEQQADIEAERAKVELKAQESRAETVRKQEEHAAELAMMREKHVLEMQIMREKAQLDALVKVQQSDASAEAKTNEQTNGKSSGPQFRLQVGDDEGVLPRVAEAMNAIDEQQAKIMAGLTGFMQTVDDLQAAMARNGAPKKVVRDNLGQIIGLMSDDGAGHKVVRDQRGEITGVEQT